MNCAMDLIDTSSYLEPNKEEYKDLLLHVSRVSDPHSQPRR